MRRIKDMLISFMTKHTPKRFFLLLWVLCCLAIPLKSAYACYLAGCGGCGTVDVHWWVCTTETEAKDFIAQHYCGACQTPIIYTTSYTTGVVQCYAPPATPGGTSCSGGVNFGGTCTEGQTQSCKTTNNCTGTITCHDGQWGVCQSTDPCCGSKDPCCWKCCQDNSGLGGI